MSSKSELSVASIFASLPAPAYRRQTFSPELPTEYQDGDDEVRTGLPDFLCKQVSSFTFFEYKNGKLNRHLSQSSSHAALQDEYGYHRELSHAELSRHFWTNGYGSGKAICLRHAYNHSLYKVLALQALHGWERYIVVFSKNPTPEDAKAYCDARLVWCTEATVSRLLASIELRANGVYFPFALHTRKYSVLVQTDPDPAHAGLTPEQVVGARRASFKAIVKAAASSRDAESKRNAEMLPF